MKTKLNSKEINELLEWFGLSDKEIHITLEDDIKGIMDKYYDEHQEHEQKDIIDYSYLFFITSCCTFNLAKLIKNYFQ